MSDQLNYGIPIELTLKLMAKLSRDICPPNFLGISDADNLKNVKRHPKKSQNLIIENINKIIQCNDTEEIKNIIETCCVELYYLLDDEKKECKTISGTQIVDNNDPQLVIELKQKLDDQKKIYEKKIKEQEEKYQRDIKEQEEKYQRDIKEQEEKYQRDIKEQEEKYQRDIKYQEEKYKKEIEAQEEEHKKEIEAQKEEHKKDIEAQEDKHKKEIEAQEDKHKKEIEDQEDKHKKEIEAQEEEHKKEIEAQEDKHKKEIEDQEDKHKKEIEAQEDKHKKEIEDQEDKHKKEIEAQEDKHKKEIEDIKKKHKNKINEDKEEIYRQLDEVKKNFDKYKIDTDKIRGDYEKLLIECNQQKELITKLKKKRDDYRNQISSLISNNEIKKTEIADCKKEVAERCEEAKKQKEEKDNFKKKFESLNEDNKNLKEENVKLKNENQQLTIKIKGLEAAALNMASLPDDNEEEVNYYVDTNSVENLQDLLANLINSNDNLPQTDNDIDIFMRSTQKQFRNILFKFYSVLEGLNIPKFPNTFDKFINEIKTGGPDKGEIIQSYINKIPAKIKRQ